MAEVTVSQLAETVGTPADKLLQQMQDAGLPQGAAADPVSEEQKETLLAYLKRSHGETEAESTPRKITLKRRTVSTLKAGSGAGRGRTVNVEVRKKRTYVRRTPTEGADVAEANAQSEVEAVPEDPAVVAERAAAEEARLREAALAAAKAEAEQRRTDAMKEANALAEQMSREKEEEEKKRLEEIARIAAAEEAKKSAASGDAESDDESKISARKDRRDRHDLDVDEAAKKGKGRTEKRKRADDFVKEALEEDVDQILSDVVVKPVTLALASGARSKRQVAPLKPVDTRHKFQAPTGDIVHQVELGETIAVSALAKKMSVKAGEVIKHLMGLGVMANINQEIEQETAVLLVEEMGHRAVLVDDNAVEKELEENLIYEGEAQPRSPVVTVMGHVDHGKTSLLDYIRSAQVVDGEAGGITQHIGAYRVKTGQGEICFIDTPGHAAFSAMRARGADCTDIIILVVAADDGVMPQTEEAIQHARSAGVPIVVAINKIDRENADPDRVKNELASKDVIPDDWGGDTQFVQVSAITGQGVDDLLEAVLLQAEILELKANESGPARGVVIEAELSRGRGPVATLLVQNGSLSRGDIIVAGGYYGRVRALNDEHGSQLASVGPSSPVSVLGLSGAPSAGDNFMVTTDERKAREVAALRTEKTEQQRLSSPATSLDSLMARFGEAETKTLNIVVKADVRGSLEAIISALEAAGNDEVKVTVVGSGVGGINESDASLAITTEAVIFGFNVRADSASKKVIEQENLDLRYYKVIYDLVDDVKAALSGMLSPEVREDIVGIALVREVFRSKRFGQIAGCIVTDGTVSRSKKIRVLRDNVVIYEGELESLRHFKDEVSDVRSGTECGIGVKNYEDVRVGDQIEVFDTREVARVL